MEATAPPITTACDVIVIGPAAGQAEKHAELVRRATKWRESAIRPAVVRGGVPAGTVIREATERLRGLPDGAAAVVHSEHTDFLRLSGNGRTRWGGIRTLADVRVTPAHRTADPTEALARLTGPWSGLFAPAVVGVPAADGLVTVHLPGIDPVPQGGLGWAHDPGTAAGRALLAGARALSVRYVPAVPPGRIVTGASGVSELHWLLDGTLRLLCAYGGEAERRVPVADGLDVVGYRVPQLADEWRFARVFRTSSRAPVAAAWGRGAADAADNALAEARATLAVSPVPEARPTADAMFAALAPADLARLHEDVQWCLGKLRVRPLGARIAADALLGDVGLAWGIVWQA